MKKIILSLILIISIIALIGYATTLSITGGVDTKKNTIVESQATISVVNSTLENSNVEEQSQIEVRSVRKTDSGYVDIQDSSIRYTQNEIQEISSDRGIFRNSREEVRIY